MKEKLTLGLAFCASFCTLKSVIALLPSLCEDYRVIPIFSETVRSTDTRFGKAEELMNEIVTLTGENPITSIKEAEPIGPEKRFDILAIAPCTGNTLAKLSHGIIDATVPMAVKAHLSACLQRCPDQGTFQHRRHDRQKALLFRSPRSG